MQFYLGTHQPAWLARASIPLFVSHRRLSGYTRLPRARASCALDSCGFSELSMFGNTERCHNSEAATATRLSRVEVDADRQRTRAHRRGGLEAE